jgi:hypothetical protein
LADCFYNSAKGKKEDAKETSKKGEERSFILICTVGDPDPHPDTYVLGLSGPHLDPLVTSNDPAPDPFIIKEKSEEKP